MKRQARCGHSCAYWACVHLHFARRPAVCGAAYGVILTTFCVFVTLCENHMPFAVFSSSTCSPCSARMVGCRRFWRKPVTKCLPLALGSDGFWARFFYRVFFFFSFHLSWEVCIRPPVSDALWPVHMCGYLCTTYAQAPLALKCYVKITRSCYCMYQAWKFLLRVSMHRHVSWAHVWKLVIPDHHLPMQRQQFWRTSFAAMHFNTNRSTKVEVLFWNYVVFLFSEIHSYNCSAS